MLFAAHPMHLAGADIQVQVCNAVGAPEAEVRKALARAGWILRQAGVEAHWSECATSVRERTGVQDRGRQSRSEPFVVSILPEDPREGGSADVLGFAVLAGRRNGAAVIYSRVISVLKENPDYADCNILGSVIVHELGHLLLRSPEHGEGIMRANWDRGEFEAMKQKRLKFSVAQARQMVANVSLYNGAASLSEGGSK